MEFFEPISIQFTDFQDDANHSDVLTISPVNKFTLNDYLLLMRLVFRGIKNAKPRLEAMPYFMTSVYLNKAVEWMPDYNDVTIRNINNTFSNMSSNSLPKFGNVFEVQMDGLEMANVLYKLENDKALNGWQPFPTRDSPYVEDF